jgi:class 3 adenylate cyclase
MKFNFYKIYLGWIPIFIFSLGAYKGMFHTFRENLDLSLITTIIFISLIISLSLRVFLSKETNYNFSKSEDKIDFNEIIKKESKKNLISFILYFITMNVLYFMAADSSIKFFIRSVFISSTSYIVFNFWTKVEIEEQLIKLASKNKIKLKEHPKIESFSKKLTKSILIVFFLLSISGFIRDVKDTQQIVIHLTGEPLNEASPFVIKSLLKMLVILVSHSLIFYFLIKKFSRTTQLALQTQIATLKEIEKGNFDTEMPNLTNDEFDSIRININHMSSQLKDREKIKSIFGKYMNPSIADRILKGGEDPDLGGREENLAIIFIDVRGFTTISEQLSAEKVVSLLNTHFSNVIKIVTKYGGEIDKFIGDAALCVFGLNEDSNPASNAALAAIEIVNSTRESDQTFIDQNLPPIRCVAGVNYGKAIAGNIGSNDRLEFTVIGDSVNIAARLEGITKELKKDVVISDAVFQKLSTEQQQLFTSEGEHPIRGKEKGILLYGHIN